MNIICMMLKCNVKDLVDNMIVLTALWKWIGVIWRRQRSGRAFYSSNHSSCMYKGKIYWKEIQKFNLKFLIKWSYYISNREINVLNLRCFFLLKIFKFLVNHYNWLWCFCYFKPPSTYKGEKGERGEQGFKGDKGDQGLPGQTAGPAGDGAKGKQE